MEQAKETFVDEASLRREKRNKRLRLGALALFFVVSLAVAKLTGLSEYATVANVRSFMEAAGVLGIVAFIVAFALGQLLHIPGMVFVGAASIAYGKLLALPTAFVGANVGLTVSFLVIRAIGGQQIGDPRPPLLSGLRKRPIAKWLPVRALLWCTAAFDRLFRRILGRLETHPIQTIAILRLIFGFAPWLTYMLAMSKVRLRDHIIGCLFGVVGPILFAVFFFDWLVGMSSTIGPW
jgi:uncharacterized membrane protein YdjX (TVP38/TMEM64 family)